MRNTELLSKWGASLAASGRRPGTITVRIAHVRALAKSGVELSTCTLADLEAYLAARAWAPATRRGVRASLRLFFEWAHAHGVRDDNPAGGLPRVVSPRGLPRPASDAVILDAMRAAPPRVRLMLELMAYCGLRRGEVAAVHTTHLTKCGEGWELRITGKGGHVRAVPVPPHVALDIERAAGWVFPGQMCGHLAPASVGKLMRPHLPPGVTPHALRHRFATEVYRRAGDIRAVQDLLGHARLDTTAIYVAVAGEDARRAAATAWALAR